MYEVQAIRYATFRRPRSEIFLSKDVHDGMVDLDYFVWLIRGPTATYLIDTGFNAASGRQRKRELMIPPSEALATLGVDPQSIKDVIITHLHYDHAGNIDRFPGARLHVQDDEMAFATGRCMCHELFRHAFDVEDVVKMVRSVYKGSVCFHDGDWELAPGISIHKIGGHTAGLQVVRVATKRGNIVLASDALHFYANMETRNPFPVMVDVVAMMEGYSRLSELADSPDHIVPGHDHEVTIRYPRVPGTALEIYSLDESPKVPETQ